MNSKTNNDQLSNHMIFPFQITLKAKVTNKVAAKHSDITLEYLQNRFTGLKASDFQKV